MSLTRGGRNGLGQTPTQDKRVRLAKVLLEAHGLTCYVDPLADGFSIKPCRRVRIINHDGKQVWMKEPVSYNDIDRAISDTLTDMGFGLKVNKQSVRYLVRTDLRLVSPCSQCGGHGRVTLSGRATNRNSMAAVHVCPECEGSGNIIAPLDTQLWEIG